MQLSDLSLSWYYGATSPVNAALNVTVREIQSCFANVKADTYAEASVRESDRARAALVPVPEMPPELKLIRIRDTSGVAPLWNTNQTQTPGTTPLFCELSEQVRRYFTGYSVPTFDLPYAGSIAPPPNIRHTYRNRQLIRDYFSAGIGAYQGTITLGVHVPTMADYNRSTLESRRIACKVLTGYSGETPGLADRTKYLVDLLPGQRLFPFISSHQYLAPDGTWAPCRILRIGTGLTADYLSTKPALLQWFSNTILRGGFIAGALAVARQFNRAHYYQYSYPALETLLNSGVNIVVPTTPPVVVTETPLPESTIKTIVLATTVNTLPELRTYQDIAKQVSDVEVKISTFEDDRAHKQRVVRDYEQQLRDYEAAVVRRRGLMAETKREIEVLEENMATYNDPAIKANFATMLKDAQDKLAAAKESLLARTDIANQNWVKNLEQSSGIVIDNLTYSGVSILANHHAINKPLDGIEFHTLAPHRITVGGTTRANAPVVMGGPYRINLYFGSGGYPSMSIRPLNANSIFGIRIDNNSYTVKWHPHSNGRTYYKEQWNLNAFSSEQNCCLGELTPLLHEAAKTQNPSLAIIGVLTWINNANGQDQWGRDWPMFPTPEQVKLYKAPEPVVVTPESQAQEAAQAIVASRAVAANQPIRTINIANQGAAPTQYIQGTVGTLDAHPALTATDILQALAADQQATALINEFNLGYIAPTQNYANTFAQVLTNTPLVPTPGNDTLPLEDEECDDDTNDPITEDEEEEEDDLEPENLTVQAAPLIPNPGYQPITMQETNE